MSERPILFSAPMVRALLNGSKTQTRRIAKPQADDKTWFENEPDGSVTWHNDGEPCCGTGIWDVPHYTGKVKCPYGQSGDRLWVREAWRAPTGIFDCRPPRELRPGTPIRYEADGINSSTTFSTGKLRPSMFMPRWASRISLEITNIRVERLQDISEADALAEGIDRERVAMYAGKGSTLSAMRAYCDLWGQINGDDGPNSWAANPWVWVIEFRRLPAMPPSTNRGGE